MFGNENELNNSLPNAMRVAVFNSAPQKNDLSQRVLDQIGNDFKERIRFTHTTNYKDIYKDVNKSPFQPDHQSLKGLVNSKWIDDLSNRIPALIIYYHHIEKGADKSAEEKKIFEAIQAIKKYDEIVYIVLFIISKDMNENPYNFNSEDKTKPYCLRNLLAKDFIYVFPSEEIWKFIDFRNFCNNILLYIRSYYHKYKTRIKEKLIKSTMREEKIECNIILGVLSIIKSRNGDKTENKYLEEAYDLICDKNFEKENYVYGIKPMNGRINLYEIRSVADWVFFKLMKIKKNKPLSTFPTMKKQIPPKSMSRSLTTSILGPNSKAFNNQEVMKSDLDILIEKFQSHINTFSYLNKNIETKDKKDNKENKDNKDNNDTNYFNLVEYFWLIERYINFANLFEENLKNISNNKKKMLSLGMIYLNQIYYFMKMIHFFKNNCQKINLNNITIKNKDIPINKIETTISFYYGKPPSYAYKDIHNPLMKFELNFDQDIYIKKFIFDRKINLEHLLDELNNKHLSNTVSFYKQLKKSSPHESNGIDYYFMILRILTISQNIKELNMENIYKIFNNLPSLDLNYIQKFPKIYTHYLDFNIKSLIYQMNLDPSISNINDFYKTKLFKYLNLIGNFRKLSDDEEKIFFQLINDDKFIPTEKNSNDNTNNNNTPNEQQTKEKIVIKLNNCINNKEKNNLFGFDYKIKDIEESQERKILDLVEYKFNFYTYLSQEKLKFNYIKIYFQCINEDVINRNNNEKSTTKREIIVREYTKEELQSFDFCNNSSIDLEHKLFMKYKKGKIYIVQIEFSLCKKENILYRIEIPNDISKMIFITNLNKKVLEFTYPKSELIAGVNQYYKFEYKVKKDSIDDIKITGYKMSLTAIPTYYTKEVPNTSMKALLRNTPDTTKPTNNNNMNLNNSTNNMSTSNNNMNNFFFNNNATNTKMSVNNYHQQVFGLKVNEQPNRNQMMPMSNFNQMNLFPQSGMSGSNINVNANLYQSTPLFNTNMNLYNNNNNLNMQQQQQQQPKVNQFSMKSFFDQKDSQPTPAPAPVTKPIPVEQVQVALPPPEYYFYNEENNSLDKTEKTFEKEYNDFESRLQNNKNNYPILIRFLHDGQYKIKFNVIYSIRHKEIDDYFEFNQETILLFKVIEPFKINNEVNSNNFLTKSKDDKSDSKWTEFLTNKDIHMNLILTNQLAEDIQIKDLIIQLDQEKLNDENKNIQVKSPIKDIIDVNILPPEVKNQILCILKSSDYSLLFETKFFNQFKGSIGKIILKWSTQSLNEFNCGDKEVPLNENKFDFPQIIVSPSEINYQYETSINDNKEIDLNLKITNNSLSSKKIVIIIENGKDIDFIVSGATKQCLNIKAGEIITSVFKLIPLIKNVELKLPSIKIWEMSYLNQDKLSSNYYFPEKITMN